MSGRNDTAVSAGPEHDLKAGRRQVARTRGALSGILLIVFGAWAALVPFIGPYFNLGLTPQPDSAWHWTSGRGLFQLLPGAVAVVGGILLLISASRAMTVLAGWLGAVAGAWIIITPSLSDLLGVSAGGPNPASGDSARAAQSLFQYFGIGAAILFVASLAIGRLSVHSVRDVRAAERRAAHEAEQERRLEEQRRADEQRRVEQQRMDEQHRADQQRYAEEQRHVQDQRHGEQRHVQDQRHGEQQHAEQQQVDQQQGAQQQGEQQAPPPRYPG